MYLILCSIHDISAIWAYRALKAVGITPIELVTQEFLSVSLSWEHWVDSEDAGFEIRLADDRIVDSRKIKGALNRLMAPDNKHFLGASPEDQAYATQEMSALFLSFLNALPRPLFNPPVAQGLSGAHRHPSEWVMLAGQAGLPTLGYQMTSSQPLQVQASWQTPLPHRGGGRSRNVFVVGQNCVGDVSPEFAHGLVRLAQSTGCPLLGVTAASGPDGMDYFINASPMPNLIEGGPSLISAISAALRKEAP